MVHRLPIKNHQYTKLFNAMRAKGWILMYGKANGMSDAFLKMLRV